MFLRIIVPSQKNGALPEGEAFLDLCGKGMWGESLVQMVPSPRLRVDL